jgi:D-alanyl-D-alanine carboxypeptidase (penicillin-binding protein 5/6)
MAAGAVLAWAPPAASRSDPPESGYGQRAEERVRRPQVTCEACLVMDDTGRVLFERHSRRRLPNASTTKMATALLVKDEASLGETVTVSGTAAGTGAGGLDLEAGQRFTVEDLLYALLLTSSNEAAVALAEHVSGSQQAFVGELNRLLGRVGAGRTHFVSAHGLDAPGHYSTALDLATIARELLRDPGLARMVQTSRTSIRGPRGLIPIENRNLLLKSYPGAIGVKTGFTAQAGDVLVAAAVRHSRRLIAVALRSVSAARDSARLLDYGFRRLRRSVLLPARGFVGALVFDPGGSTAALSSRTVRGIADPRRVTIVFRPRSRVRAPVAAGEAVGSAEVRLSGRLVEAVPAVAGRPIPTARPSWTIEALGRLLRMGHDVAARLEAW